jgi:hypothetical protein
MMVKLLLMMMMVVVVMMMILRKFGGKLWTGRFWIMIRTTGEPFEHGNETLSSIKGGEFLDYLKKCCYPSR